MRKKSSTRKKCLQISSLFIVLLLFSTAVFYVNGRTTNRISNDDPSFISIATFNIYRWGQFKEDRKDYDALADLIDDYDLILVQEVMPHHSDERIPKLMEKLDDNYLCFDTSRTGKNNYYEKYAFIYNKDTIENTDKGDFIIEKPEGNEHFSRVPYLAYFKAGNFDFGIINVHLLWGSEEEDRTKETKHFAKWLKTKLGDLKDGDEKDFIVAGDFNRYGKNWKSFDEFLFEGWQDFYRILTLEPPDRLKTNCARKTHKTYDNIFISPGAENEFGKNAAEIDNTIGVIPWDIWDFWKDQQLNQIKRIISDHRPVWVKFRIDKQDDD